ncbi:MAG: class I SAM-dependent methyltransferase [Conexivisphaerales archaeon]
MLRKFLFLALQPVNVNSSNLREDMKTDSIQEIMRVFDTFAEDFDTWFVRNKEVFLTELNAIIAAQPNGSILDVGVGSGVFASRLNVELGIDLSEKMLKISSARGLQVVQADASKLPIRERCFDTVVSTFTVCFVLDEVAMFREISRVMKKNGKFILGEITRDSAWGNKYTEEGVKGHRFYSKARFFTLSETISSLEKTGFTIRDVYGTLTYSPYDPAYNEKAYHLELDDEDLNRYSFLTLVCYLR